MAVIRPQTGPQEEFLSNSADIVIYGGAAGSGKTFAILLEPLRHIHNPKFGAVIFRRESTQITNEGGVWDEAMTLYPVLSGVPRTSPKRRFIFPSKAKISFEHLNRETDVLSWQGAQIALIIFEELTHFTRSQFFYMLSRSRSMSGVRPYMRATTNPDADSWVAQLISWWIDDVTGYPIPERSGVIRYFIRVGDELEWRDSENELINEFGVKRIDIKSLSFIPASIYDNKKLMEKDPGYLANLKALPIVERERLLGGNWKIRPAAGLYFPKHNANMIPIGPGLDGMTWIRAWDLAATEPGESNPDPDWTVGVLFGKYPNGRFVIRDVKRVRMSAHKVRQLIKQTAMNDGYQVRISMPEDPGQAGSEQAASYVAMLSGYNVFKKRASNDKISRAEPFAAQWQAGNVDVVIAEWNTVFFNELEQFPDGNHDDIVDAGSDGFFNLTSIHDASLGMNVAAL